MTDKISRKQKAKHLFSNDSISKIRAYNNNYLPNGGNDRLLEPLFKSRPKNPTMLPHIKTDHTLHNNTGNTAVTASSIGTAKLDNIE